MHNAQSDRHCCYRAYSWKEVCGSISLALMVMLQHTAKRYTLTVVILTPGAAPWKHALHTITILQSPFQVDIHLKFRCGQIYKRTRGIVSVDSPWPVHIHIYGLALHRATWNMPLPLHTIIIINSVFLGFMHWHAWPELVTQLGSLDLGSLYNFESSFWPNSPPSQNPSKLNAIHTWLCRYRCHLFVLTPLLHQYSMYVLSNESKRLSFIIIRGFWFPIVRMFNVWAPRLRLRFQSTERNVLLLRLFRFWYVFDAQKSE